MTCIFHAGRLETPLRCRYFEIGLPRTASRSVAWAAHLLGLKSRHLCGCVECAKDAAVKLLAGSTDLDLYKACEYSGNVASVHWRKLAQDRPDAKFILLNRPLNGWLESHRRRTGMYNRGAKQSRNRPMTWMDVYMIQVFGQYPYDEVGWRYRHGRHADEIRNWIMSKRLLELNVFNTPDDVLWNKLAAFVDRPPPPAGTAFPHVTGRIARGLSRSG